MSRAIGTVSSNLTLSAILRKRDNCGDIKVRSYKYDLGSGNLKHFYFLRSTYFQPDIFLGRCNTFTKYVSEFFGLPYQPVQFFIH